MTPRWPFLSLFAAAGVVLAFPAVASQFVDLAAGDDAAGDRAGRDAQFPDLHRGAGGYWQSRPR